MTGQPYKVVAELDVPFGEETVERLIAPIVDCGGAVGRSALGRTEVILTLPADSVCQANMIALSILEQYPSSTLLSLRVLTAADLDRSTEAVELPPLVSVNEAAKELGVSRQSILKSIKSAELPATRVGQTWVVRASAVQARARDAESA